jgi:hypothetical protein
LHSVAGAFNPEAVSIQVDPTLRGRRLCVSIASQDGMYYAENLYEVSAAAPPVSTFQTVTRYSTELKKYAADQIAVNVRVTEDCNAAVDGEILPSLINSASGDLLLVADINADPDRLAVELIRRGGSSWKASCSTGDGPRVAFTSSCEFRPSSLPAGKYDMVVHLRERTRIRDIHFSVWIP